MCELLWSDPQPQLGRGPSKRGVGLSFGADVTKRFLDDNNLGETLYLSPNNYLFILLAAVVLYSKTKHHLVNIFSYRFSSAVT